MSTDLNNDWLFAGASDTTPSLMNLNEVRGYVDVVEDYRIAGWVYNPAITVQRIGLAINGIIVSSLPALIQRLDVRDEGFGDGICGFDILLPRNVFGGGNYSIRVFEEATGVTVGKGEFILEEGMLTSSRNINLSTLTIGQFLDCYENICIQDFVHHLADQIGQKLSNLSAREASCAIFTLVLNREPDPVAYESLCDMMPSINNYRRVAEGMLNSHEFRSKFKLRALQEKLDKFTLPEMFMEA